MKNHTASSKTWTVDKWDSPDPIPHFGGPTHKEEFYRGFLENLVCLFKVLAENVETQSNQKNYKSYF
jgi:hypothetical protein